MLHLKDYVRVLFSPLAFELKTLNRVAEIGPNIINIFFTLFLKLTLRLVKVLLN